MLYCSTPMHPSGDEEAYLPASRRDARVQSRPVARVGIHSRHSRCHANIHHDDRLPAPPTGELVSMHGKACLPTHSSFKADIHALQTQTLRLLQSRFAMLTASLVYAVGMFSWLLSGRLHQLAPVMHHAFAQQASSPSPLLAYESRFFPTAYC